MQCEAIIHFHDDLRANYPAILPIYTTQWYSHGTLHHIGSITHAYNITITVGVNSFTIYDVRLGSSSTSPTTSGRVEVLTQRGWMPVCGYSWDSAESRVLCRQLGYAYSFYSKKH